MCEMPLDPDREDRSAEYPETRPLRQRARPTGAGRGRPAWLAVLLAVVLAAAVAPAAAATAVVSQVRGSVQRADDGSPLQPLQLLAAGVVVSLAPRAEATLLCEGDRAVHLEGPVRWTVGAAGCNEGRAVARGSYALLAPASGEPRDFHGSLFDLAASRSDSAGSKVANLLTPRSPQRATTWIADGAPELVWSAVSRALTYHLVLTRGGTEAAVEVAAANAGCRSDPLFASARACRHPWPWPPLAAGEEVGLRIETDTPDPDWPHRVSDESRLRRLGSAAQRTLDRRLTALDDPGLPEGSRALLRSAAYADAEVYNAAAKELAGAAEAAPQPALLVRLADVHLGLGLSDAALSEYQRAAQMLPRTGQDDVRAGVELGLGRLYRRGDQPQVAAEHLRRAARLLRRTGRSEEADRVDQEASRVERDLR